jgi:hypothetical protein
MRTFASPEDRAVAQLRVAYKAQLGRGFDRPTALERAARMRMAASAMEQQ